MPDKLQAIMKHGGVDHLRKFVCPRPHAVCSLLSWMHHSCNEPIPINQFNQIRRNIVIQ